VETHIPPLDLYLDSKVAGLQSRIADSGIGQLIQKACSTTWTRIKNKEKEEA
jgi:hypothetical protein